MIYINGRFLSQRTSGVQRFAREITKALDRLVGRRPSAYSWRLAVPPGVANDLSLKNIEVCDVGEHRGHLWEQLDLYRAARDSVLVNLCNSGPVMHRSSVTIIHDAMVFRTPENFSFAYRTVHRNLGRILARRSRIGTVSEFSRSELSQVIGAKSVFVVPNSAEHLSAIEPAWDVVEKLELARARYAMFVGSPTPNKNLRTAIAAIEHLGDAGPKFVIIGVASQSVFQGATSRSTDKIVFTGHLSDAEVAALYKSAGVLVFPSLYEGFGIPPLEAMTHDCPVIASDIPPVREVCGDAALYVDATDKVAIAEAVSCVLSDVSLRNDLVRRGRKQKSRFSWDKSADLLYDAVVSDAARSSTGGKP